MVFPVWDLLEEIYLYEMVVRSGQAVYGTEDEDVPLELDHYLAWNDNPKVREDWDTYDIKAGLNFLHDKGWIRKNDAELWQITKDGMEQLNQEKARERQETSNALMGIFTFALVMVSMVQVLSRLWNPQGMWGTILSLLLLLILAGMYIPLMDIMDTSFKGMIRRMLPF